MKSVMEPLHKYMDMQRARFVRERAEQRELEKQFPVDWDGFLNEMLERPAGAYFTVKSPIISTNPHTGKKTQE